MRPPVIETYEMSGNLTRPINFLNGFMSLAASDFANDSDNDWTDGANVDAHVYAGYTYDYYFKRFGRRGLDNANIRIRSLTHPVNRQDAFTASSPESRHLLPERVLCGRRYHGLRRGSPPNPRSTAGSGTFRPARWTSSPTSSTHGVTDYSSDLIYANESGALNEAFSDIMGTAVPSSSSRPGPAAEPPTSLSATT